MKETKELQSLKDFKKSQWKRVAKLKSNYKMNPVTGWIDSRTLEGSYIRYKTNK
tara:strand:- start:409 stop:570 length:162 start_codon:yes stop_codon:yes gene_type:complete